MIVVAFVVFIVIIFVIIVIIIIIIMVQVYTLYTELDDLDEAGAVFTRLLELDPTDHYVNSKRRRIYELKNIRKRQEKNRK